MSSFDLAITTTVLALSALCYAYAKSTGRSHPLPPSPKSYPLIGNILAIPARDQYIAYRQWSRELNSDVILIKLPGQSMVVLNSADSISEFFEKRGKQYFARPSIPLLSDPALLDWSRHTAFLPYGERWKQQRQLMHSSFRKSRVHIHTEAQTRHSRQAILKIIQQPHKFSDIFQWMLNFQILSCVYGYETTSQDDEMVRLSESASRNLGKAILPFNFMVNVMPFLNRLPSWFPGMGWKAVARKWNEELKQTIELPYEFTVRQMAEGTAIPSAVGEMLKSLQTRPESIDSEDRDRAMWTAGSIFTSAVDSLHATLQVVMLAMTLYPEVQSKARHEIELITEGKRLPEIGDMDQMPYVRCVILEVLRWQPVTPLGLPHTCGEDDEYNGFTIPKNSIVFGNIWAINRDESRYPDPDAFLPERFMDPTVPEPVTFGFGRRICPGMYFAHTTLFINVVTLLATCDVRPMRDDDGKEILPAIQMIQGPLAMTPAPFDCDITVRSEAQRQMLLGVVEHDE